MAKSRLVSTNEAIAARLTREFLRVETAVTGRYMKIEDTFVSRYLKRDGETLSEAKARLKQKKAPGRHRP